LETTTAPKKTRVAETSAATEEPKIVVAAVTAHESTQNNQPVVQTAPPSKPDNAAPETYQARRIQIERQTPAVPPLQVAIEKGYQAWQQGDLDAARAAYEQALDLSPQHRDAVLGAAAVAVRQGRLDEALSFYQQRLNADPQDPHARAGLLSLLTTDSSDPALEAQLQSLLHRYPEAAHLHFLQGALFAGKSQWHAAQQAFFEAWRRERTHPDFAYNLAIALDHLGQTREALRFYQTALTLAAVKPAGFSVSLLQERVTTLEGVAP
jgi:Flp pilus assembly protein TadD